MEFKRNALSVREAKQIDLVQYLRKLGHEPKRINGSDYWYISPLRPAEKTPSFKVNSRLNAWYDHGLGKGGSIIDFGIHFYKCSIGDLLKNLAGNIDLNRTFDEPPDRGKTLDKQIEIAEEKPLTSPALLSYIQQRHIDLNIARKYCLEIRYLLKGKQYYAVGFKNDLGGFEIRNAYVKLASKPKGITSLIQGGKEAATFEGFMDFLSFKTLYRNFPENRFDFFILNSTSFFDQTLPVLQKYEKSHLFLDRGATGRKCTQQALALNSRFIDQSHRYKQHDDLNEYLVSLASRNRLKL